MNSLITTVIAFGVIGLVVGIVLSIAAKVFEVKTDPKIDEVLGNLPGANSVDAVTPVAVLVRKPLLKAKLL